MPGWSGALGAMPVFEGTTWADHVGVAWFFKRMAATLLSIFGLLALSLSALGLYGVMAYAVNQRTREMGIRISVGAQRSDVLKLILGQGLILATVGTAIGLVAALVVTRFTAPF